MAVKDVTKAVIPAAGLGTRFLPATKATPKEMLPVVDKPAIQYVVEEAVAAGLDDVLMITGRSKVSIENHFDRAYELEEALAAKGDAERLAQVRESDELATVHYVRQGDPKGLGHAVLCAAHHVGDEPFAVLLGDDLIDSRDPLLSRMIEVRERHGGSVVALMEVDPEQVSQYGSAAITPTAEEDVVTVTDLVEKPVPGSAPSNWIVIGRYVCDPAVFEVLRDTPPGRGGEIQLTDALQALPKPRAILIVSAHWESAPLSVSATGAGTPLVYDFGGFKPVFYTLQYSTPDASALARRVAAAMPDSEPLHEHTSRGLDHGAWVPLMVMYPLADVPVLQLSLPTHDPDRLLELGRRLRALREEGVLIVGSGFMTHGLPFLTREHWIGGGAPPAWSQDFDAWAADALARGDVDTLSRFASQAPGMPFAHPTVEHYTPLFVTLGASDRPDAPARTVIDGYFMGLSKRSLQAA